MKLLKTIFYFSVFFFLSAPGVLAANQNYFEFSPDLTASLKIAGLQAPAQSFIPFNDYVSGFDIWLENQGSAGNLVVSLEDAAGTELARKTVTAPHTVKTWFGQKFHFDFNSAVSVSAGSGYKVHFETSLPELKIFYANLAQLRQHNADYSIDKAVSPALLAGVEQDFAFKFALYDSDSDRSDPEILNAVPVLISPEQVEIRFNSNEPVDSQIEFGESGGSLNQNSPFNQFFRRCNLEISTCTKSLDVLPDRQYDFKLTLRDYWNNEAYATGTFRTSAGWVYQAPTSTPSGDNQPPAISNARAVSLTDKSAVIAWTTDEPANSGVLLRYNRPGSQVITSVGDTTFELEHAISFSGFLEPRTDYYVLVTSFDSSNNSASQLLYFTTLPTPVVPPPVLPPSLPQTLNIVSPAGSGQPTTISWNASASGPANGYRADVFDRNRRLVRQEALPPKADSLSLSGLPEGDYDVIVYKHEGDVFEKIAPPAKISSPAPPKKKLYENNFFYLGILGIILSAIIIVVVVLKFRKK